MKKKNKVKEKAKKKKNTERVPFAYFHPFEEGKRCPGRREDKWASPYELVKYDSSVVKMTL